MVKPLEKKEIKTGKLCVGKVEFTSVFGNRRISMACGTRRQNCVLSSEFTKSFLQRVFIFYFRVYIILLLFNEMGNVQIGPIKDSEKGNSKKSSTAVTIEAMDHCWEINFNIIDQSPTLASLFQEIPRTGKSVEVIYEDITEDLDPMDVERALRFINLTPKEIKKDLSIIGIPDLIRGLFLANYLQSVCFNFGYIRVFI